MSRQGATATLRASFGLRTIFRHPEDPPDDPEGETEHRAGRVPILGHTASGKSVGFCEVLPYWAGLPSESVLSFVKWECKGLPCRVIKRIHSER